MNVLFHEEVVLLSARNSKFYKYKTLRFKRNKKKGLITPDF